MRVEYVCVGCGLRATRDSNLPNEDIIARCSCGELMTRVEDGKE